MGVKEQIDIARGILKGQGDKCAECGEPLKYEDATKRSRSFDIICQPCRAKPQADIVVLDEATDWTEDRESKL